MASSAARWGGSAGGGGAGRRAGARGGLGAGRGRTPYRVCVDLADRATKCSCPSRKFPCKHALALQLRAGREPRAPGRPALLGGRVAGAAAAGRGAGRRVAGGRAAPGPREGEDGPRPGGGGARRRGRPGRLAGRRRGRGHRRAARAGRGLVARRW
ncbi:SWIM zinc finger family protein, partial [Saccharothrix algeriensis]